MEMAKNANDVRVFDPSRLSGILLLREYEDDVFGEMTALFCDRAATRLARAGREAARGDGVALAETAHAIANSATLLGAERMASAASALEAAARSGCFDIAPALIATLAQAFDITRAALLSVGARRRES